MDDEELRARAEEPLTDEVARGPSDHHASVLATLRTRPKGAPAILISNCPQDGTRATR